MAAQKTRWHLWQKKESPPLICTPDSVFSLLSYALLTCCTPCQHRWTQARLMSRPQGGSGRAFLPSGLVNAVRLSPEGAYIHTVGVTVTLLSRSSKWVRWDGSLLGERARLSSIRHGTIQLDCDDIMPLSHCGAAVGAAVSQQEGHGLHLASLYSLNHLTLLARASPRRSSLVPRTKGMWV